MRLLNLCYPALTVLLLTRCAAVPMPAVVIPQSEKSIEGTAYLGNNGFGLNILYATKGLVLFNAAAQISNIRTDSKGYDIGIGKSWRGSGDWKMAMITFGYGKYVAEPYTMGATGQVYEVDSDAYRGSIYFNGVFNKKWGMVNRITYYWGRSQWARVLAPPVEKHDYSAIAFEPCFYYLPGGKRTLIFVFGATLSGTLKGYKAQNGEGGSDLKPSPLYITFGYRFAQPNQD